MALSDVDRARLTAERLALLSAINTGALRVVFDGPPKRDVTYRSLSDMRSILADLDRQLAEGTRPQQIRFMTGKGL